MPVMRDGFESLGWPLRPQGPESRIMKLSFLQPVLFLAAALGLAAAEPARKTITHEDLWPLKRVGAPTPSPDGKWAVFSVTNPAYDAKDQSSDLWIVPVDGSAPARQLTQTKSGESGVA